MCSYILLSNYKHFLKIPHQNTLCKCFFLYLRTEMIPVLTLTYFTSKINQIVKIFTVMIFKYSLLPKILFMIRAID